MDGSGTGGGKLVDRGVVSAPRASDGELLGSLGIDLDSVRHQTEQRFGFQSDRLAAGAASLLR